MFDLDSVEPEFENLDCLRDDALLKSPDFEMDPQKLRAHIGDMNTEEFWLQKGLIYTN